MKKLLSILLVLLSFSAFADTTCSIIGNQRICRDGYGNSSTQQQIGNQAITRYNDGT